ncbi:carboxypeptidase-like regulatory domain-containing protein [Flavobacterium sp.]|jgi:hypothetical protein|uniref:carboxypeptidase-like regulatory domain-containing protein n=1 Tax=Flavobacterium sp. TaxID=239 RepID=UPI0037BEFA9A
MRYFVVFFLVALANTVGAQEATTTQSISGTIVNEFTFIPVSNVNIINLNKAKATVSDSKGYFELIASVNDTLHLSMVGFQSIKMRITNDWVKNKTTTIKLTEKAIALEEVIIQPYMLTGYLEIDTKLIPSRENYRYSISGLEQGYEAGEYSPSAFGKIMGSLFNPADMLYNFFGKKPKELKRLKEMKKDPSVRAMLENKFDRETLSMILGVNKDEIPELLQRCNYSEAFAKSANDLQILEAITQCHEEYKVLKKK